MRDGSQGLLQSRKRSPTYIADIVIIPFAALKPILGKEHKHGNDGKDEIDQQNAKKTRHGMQTKNRCRGTRRGQAGGWACQGEGKSQGNGPHTIHEYPAPLGKGDLKVRTNELVDCLDLSVLRIMEKNAMG